MNGTWEGEAPAKVNLLLRVLAREDSGYHQIETVFQALELADAVRLELGAGAGISLELAGVAAGELGPGEENLVVRAARAFGTEFERTGGRFPALRIHLEKRIPHGAGLGGGSSDAASVLLGLNELLDSPIPPAELLRIGGDLGSDVPFFLAGTPLALAWGRGDRLLPLPALPPRPVLLAMPEEGMATPWAYARLARHREERGSRARPALLSGAGFASWQAVAAAAENAFEEALFPERAELARLREEMERAGGSPALLSGSGSTVFGVFPDGPAAEGAAVRLEAAFPGTRFAITWTRGSAGVTG